MSRRDISGGGSSIVAGDGSSVRAQVYARDSRRRRAGRRPRVSLHVLRYTVPPTILQLR